jgi:hypothetical protein
MEAEYISLANGMQDGIWILIVAKELMNADPMLYFHIDNKFAIEISKQSNKHSHAKHIDIITPVAKCPCIRDTLQF